MSNMLYETFANFIALTRQNWQNAWRNKAFRVALVTGVLLIIAASVSTDYFFRYIQHLKDGVTPDDWILKELPAINVSIPIVILMTSAILLFQVRCAANPDMFLVLTWTLLFQLIFRIITIDVTRFNTPPELIVLKDPVSSILYHGGFITRDLFYSGHTASMFVFFLCSRKKYDKYFMLFATIGVGILLLVQHVHYTIDVVAAPFFAFACYRLAKKVILLQNAYSSSIYLPLKD